MCFSIQIDKNIKNLAHLFNAEVASHEFIKLQQNLESYLKMGMKPPSDDGKVYPNYFAPVIKSHLGKRIIHPMRYRIRPNGSHEEIPAKFNVFNARLDSLETRKTWKNLLGKNHALVPLKKFYEWVPDENKKTKLISFFQKNEELIWVPCLYDYWENQEKTLSYYSFAIITSEPNPEVLEMGHDRSPIFLKEENLDLWLNEKNKIKALEYLKDCKKSFYQYEWV